MESGFGEIEASSEGVANYITSDTTNSKVLTLPGNCNPQLNYVHKSSDRKTT